MHQQKHQYTQSLLIICILQSLHNDQIEKSENFHELIKSALD